MIVQCLVDGNNNKNEIENTAKILKIMTLLLLVFPLNDECFKSLIELHEQLQYQILDYSNSKDFQENYAKKQTYISAFIKHLISLFTETITLEPMELELLIEGAILDYIVTYLIIY